MATAFSPPPTYAEVVIFDEDGKKPKFNPIWLKWFVDVAALLTASGGGGGGIDHNSLSTLQGGTANQYYHLSSGNYTALTAGFTGTGLLVRATAPTLGVTVATSIKISAGGYIASNNAAGIDASITTAALVGKTITVKDGIITGFA